MREKLLSTPDRLVGWLGPDFRQGLVLLNRRGAQRASVPLCDERHRRHLLLEHQWCFAGFESLVRIPERRTELRAIITDRARAAVERFGAGYGVSRHMSSNAGIIVANSHVTQRRGRNSNLSRAEQPKASLNVL